ncbi:hypothetical protein L8T48_06180 [Campylobacter lari]|uniref:hypothetical protein n=1 Tax=Campylobacter lari TaxID=201 RepID=UPI001F08A5C3|nr:hypothetical protein [Campylobacter lari]EHH9692639.1 hypothetical protein [Campylobacter lari]EHS0800456.1 hypothetical protein [Campylobacter lari]MCH3697585.1 hypothetical protein [Campylobacter lari]MCV3334579.1 hypothetical protein [Campylobacter lari]MCV3351078.1 hypothetical protein [Campylobacter lari]
MGSEILTLSEDKIKNIKKKLADIIGSSYVNNIKEIDEESVNDFAINDEEYIKKHKNLFIISDKKDKLLDLEINLKELSSLTDDIDFQIKFEGYRIAFIDSQSEENIKIKQNLYFSNCDFKAIELKNICFEKFEIDGYKYENDQKKSIVFKACEFKELFLKNNTFSENVRFIEKTKIEYLHVELNKFSKYFFIQDCFIGNINLWKNKFENRCYFVDSKFGYEQNGDYKIKLNFSNAHFKDNAYFNNSKFYNYTDFHECEFEKIACFYGVTFDKAPNFSQVIFKENLNAVNTNLNFTFDGLKIQIKEEEENFNKDKNGQYQRSLDKFANDFRDSFRVFKNALIKDNNLLDASNFHKYELYCKEIELKESWNRIKNVKTDEDLRQNNKNYSQLTDFLLLGFYRKLCDHHTDFLRVFNNFILLISLHVLYGIVIFRINDKEIIDDAKIYLSDTFNYDNIFWYVLGILLFICVSSLYFCKNKEKTHMIDRESIIKKFKWSRIIIKEIYTFFLVFTICYLGISTFGIVGDFLAKFFDLKIFKNVVYISIACISFIGLFLFFINSFVFRYVFLSCSYFILAFVLFLKPKEFYFIYNIFKENNENLIIINSLNVVYFILVILVIFSLQKTARKNSIVPS